jgi:hypothetical protein
MFKRDHKGEGSHPRHVYVALSRTATRRTRSSRLGSLHYMRTGPEELLYLLYCTSNAKYVESAGRKAAGIQVPLWAPQLQQFSI